MLQDQRDAVPPEAHRAVDAVLRAADQLGSLLETVSALVDLPDRLPAVVDFAEVRRAVSELLKNAATHSPAGPESTRATGTVCSSRSSAAPTRARR